ncbi:hypothetical protein [Streptomyces aidingensis]|uniref:Helix-turn-helix domain-containing protein n=1 Tax=Streptomyces aidingensis TaxID=910347 RepID=A0A1I1TK77_9ACTN|nr:hypothetical protein [Streptomyces aidingensis]SFD59042.1 hypothetical protein SAMN05421773_12019 [Streptomyces aidingensis]
MAAPQVSAPAHGLRHVRARHTKNFTILRNQLLQRPGSAVTIGVAAYLLSLPEGTPVSVERLARHFAEGTIRIRRALNELEAEGYLVRCRERAGDGTVRTRYVVHHRPGTASDTHVVPAPRPRTRPRPLSAPAANLPAPSPAPGPQAEPAPEPEPTSDQAAAVLLGLRARDPRLCLSERETRELGPAVDDWLRRGVTPSQIARTLTAGLPQPLTHRPVRLLAYRLREYLPPRATAHPADDPSPALPPPLRTCAGCHNVAFRSHTETHCRTCRPEAPLPTAPAG